MNKQELNASLQFLFAENAPTEIVLYAILKGNDQPLKLDIKGEDLPEIAKMFLESIQSNILEKDDFSILPLSTADERGKCFYQYDLELPDELKLLESVIVNEHNTFSFRTNQIGDIDSLIIVIGVGEKEVSILKKLAPVEVIGRGGYLLGKSNQRFERFNEQLLRIGSKFQIIRVDSNLIILDLNAIEKSFGFHDVIKREAALGLTAIDNMHIVKDMNSLNSMIDNISFARKLTKIAKSSPVIKLGISNVDIIAFSKRHPATAKMKYSDNDTKFDLKSKALKDLFVKLLNDDLLTSELTKMFYESLAKDDVNNEEIIEAN
jgi:hypothetical protein